jgi:hypothetical protein
MNRMAGWSRLGDRLVAVGCARKADAGPWATRRPDEVRQAIDELANRYEPAELNRIGFRLYEKFRPDVPHGNEGWGKRAVLDVEMIRAAK